MNHEWWSRMRQDAEETFWRKQHENAEQPDRWRNLHEGLTGAWKLANGQITESAIEQMLGEALLERAGKFGYRAVPQYKMDRYRFDFAIENIEKGTIVALVECDGRAFHCTKEQLANDARKDALAKENGFLIVRLTGHEICRDAKRAAEKVLFAVFPR